MKKGPKVLASSTNVPRMRASIYPRSRRKLTCFLFFSPLRARI